MTTPRFLPEEELRATEKEAETVAPTLYYGGGGAMQAEFLPVFVGMHVRRVKGIVDNILEEAEQLLEPNSSAALVWAVQAFELFVKECICRPALLHNLGWDSETSTEVYKLLVERNGGKAAASLLRPMLRFNLEDVKTSTGVRVWHRLLETERGVVASRNRIIHRGDKASEKEAREALELIRTFIRHLAEDFEFKVGDYMETYERPNPKDSI